MDLNIGFTFKNVVTHIFNGWTGLRLAVEHGMGNHQSAIELINDTVEFCIQNLNLCQDDIEEFLEQHMDERFDTICEDNSIREISALIIRYLRMYSEQRFEEIRAELSLLPPPCSMFLNSQFAKSDSDSDDVEEEEIEQAHNTNARSNKLPDADGWITITHKKKS